jgi:hypothetical protein
MIIKQHISIVLTEDRIITRHIPGLIIGKAGGDMYQNPRYYVNRPLPLGACRIGPDLDRNPVRKPRLP